MIEGNLKHIQFFERIYFFIAISLSIYNIGFNWVLSSLGKKPTYLFSKLKGDLNV